METWNHRPIEDNLEAQIKQLSAYALEMEARLIPYPELEKCKCCGKQDGIGWWITSDELWKQLIEGIDGNILCLQCADAIAKKKGIFSKDILVYFAGDNLQSAKTADPYVKHLEDMLVLAKENAAKRVEALEARIKRLLVYALEAETTYMRKVEGLEKRLSEGLYTYEELAQLEIDAENTPFFGICHEAYRQRKILRQYMNAEHALRCAFMQYRDKGKGIENIPYEVLHEEISKHAFDKLYPAADDALLLSIMLNACLGNTLKRDADGVVLSQQIVTSIIKDEETNKLRARIAELKQAALDREKDFARMVAEHGAALAETKARAFDYGISSSLCALWAIQGRPSAEMMAQDMGYQLRELAQSTGDDLLLKLIAEDEDGQ